MRARRPRSNSRAVSKTPESPRSSTPTSHAMECSPGPNLEETAALARAVAIPVIASGGMSSEEDVLRAASCADGIIAGAIVGTAVYTGAVEIGRVLEKLSCS